jgi:Zn-dependent protease
MLGSPAFRLFGFRVQVRPGFLMFMALVVVVNGGEFGFWLAGSAAVLTLLHELGHAFAARATGAEAEIALDFLAGYASFVPTRALKRWERAGISLAGPATQILVGVTALFLMGVNPLDVDPSTAEFALHRLPALAIWWTGPVMGLLNLVPVLPLDGGHIAQALVDTVLPGRSRRVMLWFSLAITGPAAIYCYLTPRFQHFALFLVFPFMLQMSMLQRDRAKPSRKRSRGALAEAELWSTGRVGEMPEGLVPSPWFRARQQLTEGQPETARALLLADFADPTPPNWWPPDAADPEQLRPLLDLLPRPLPRGRTYSELALARVLERTGDHEAAVRYVAEVYADARATPLALVAARGAAALGDQSIALAWIRAAADAGTDPDGLAEEMDHHDGFTVLRGDERFVAIRRQLAAD